MHHLTNGSGQPPAPIQTPYYIALSAVAEIDQHLCEGTRHYRTKQGELLTSLDEVVNAWLAGDLQEVSDAP